MSDGQASRVGSMFGPYHLKRLLGRGGMGEVYEAEHTVKEWTVAVKLMSDTFSRDPVFRERMKREARIAGRLQEPHVVPIHDYGEIDGQMFMEMRLIEGTDLDSVLKRFGPLTPPRAVAIITQIASGACQDNCVRCCGHLLLGHSGSRSGNWIAKVFSASVQRQVPDPWVDPRFWLMFRMAK
jgi:serine/threonine protein kinase